MTPSQVDVATQSTVTLAFFWNRSIYSSGKSNQIDLTGLQCVTSRRSPG